MADCFLLDKYLLLKIFHLPDYNTVRSDNTIPYSDHKSHQYSSLHFSPDHHPGSLSLQNPYTDKSHLHFHLLLQGCLYFPGYLCCKDNIMLHSVEIFLLRGHFHRFQSDSVNSGFHLYQLCKPQLHPDNNS